MSLSKFWWSWSCSLFPSLVCVAETAMVLGLNSAKSTASQSQTSRWSPSCGLWYYQRNKHLDSSLLLHIHTKGSFQDPFGMWVIQCLCSSGCHHSELSGVPQALLWRRMGTSLLCAYRCAKMGPSFSSHPTSKQFLRHLVYIPPPYIHNQCKLSLPSDGKDVVWQ